MHGTLTIARLTWMEARRRRIVLAAVIGGALFLLLFGLAVGFISRHSPGTGAAATVMLRVQYLILAQAGLYVTTFLSYAVAILLPVDTLSGEIDSGVMQTLAAKPIARSAILLGKTMTYWLMAAAYLLLMAAGVVLIVWFLVGVAPTHLERALPIMVLGVTVPLVVSVAGGTRLKTITNGMVAFAYYGIAFLGGWIEQVGAAVGNDSARRVGTAISLFSPADAMWRRAAFEMQPAVMRRFPEVSPFGAISVPSSAMIVWTIGVVAAVLVLALYLFRRRAL
jgi:Cu-processing system permease protein